MLFWCFNCRALDKTISDIEMRLAAARAAQAMSQGMSPSDSEGDQGIMRHRMSFVMGVFTTFANRKRRDSIRQTWMPQGRCPFLNFCPVEPLFHVKCWTFCRWSATKTGREGCCYPFCHWTQVLTLFRELELGFKANNDTILFVVYSWNLGIPSCSENPNPNNEVDRAIDAEDKEYNDILRLVCLISVKLFFWREVSSFLLLLLFLIHDPHHWCVCNIDNPLQNHVEGYGGLPMKIQMFLSTALTTWDADFYVKVDDNVHVNIGMPTWGPFHFYESAIAPVHCTEIGGTLLIQVSPDRFWHDTGWNLGCTLAAWNPGLLLRKSSVP